MRAGPRAWTAVLTGLLLLEGCYEIPPVVPRGYVGSPAAPGWPPIAVYDSDPFHLRNRWFHRQFGDRSRDGSILRPHGDEPLGLLMNPSPVDQAEILSILGALAVEPLREPELRDTRACVTRAIFRSDLLAESFRVSCDWPEGAHRDEVSRLLRQCAGSERGLPDGWDPDRLLIAPPLREGQWLTAKPPEAPGLTASAVDPRETRLFRRAQPRTASVLLRLRILARKEGGLEPLPIASDCWQILEGDDGPTYRVFRFDRAEWVEGRDPWRENPAGAEITIRSPVAPGHVLRGPVERLCSSCHCRT